MKPYDENFVVNRVSPTFYNLYGQAGRLFGDDPTSLVWPSRTQYDIDSGMDPEQSLSKHANECAIALGLPPITVEPPPQGQNWRTARGLFRSYGFAFGDDNGPFPALSVTMFNAQTLYDQDMERLYKNLEFCRNNGVDIIRVLCYTDWASPRGIQFDPNLMRQTIELIWSFGMRTEVSIFGSTYFGDYEDAVRRLGETLAPLAEAIAFYEIGNEPFNPNAAYLSVSDLQKLAAVLQPLVPNLIALGSPTDIQQEIEDFKPNADLATPHYDRKNDTEEGDWRPIRQPWEGRLVDFPCCNNEPIGPGSSVESLQDVNLQRVAANCSWTAQNGIHCWHSKSGVGNDEDTPLGTEPGLPGLAIARKILPLDIANWYPENWHWEGNPFVTEEGSVTDNGMDSRGTIRTITCMNGPNFVCHPFGIPIGATLRAKKNMEFKLYAFRGSEYVVIQDVSLLKDEKITLGAENDYFLIGRLT